MNSSLYLNMVVLRKMALFVLLINSMVKEHHEAYFLTRLSDSWDDFLALSLGSFWVHKRSEINHGNGWIVDVFDSTPFLHRLLGGLFAFRFHVPRGTSLLRNRSYRLHLCLLTCECGYIWILWSMTVITNLQSKLGVEWWCGAWVGDRGSGSGRNPNKDLQKH